jgi:hypothetical protein
MVCPRLRPGIGVVDVADRVRIRVLVARRPGRDREREVPVAGPAEHPRIRHLLELDSDADLRRLALQVLDEVGIGEVRAMDHPDRESVRMSGPCQMCARLVEIEEAAMIDGASSWTVLMRVFLPLLAPAMATTGLLAFIAAWNEFLFALTFTLTDDKHTVPVAIALISGASAFEVPWGRIMAASVTVTVPLIVLVLVFQRRIVTGLTAGAVKG